MTIEYPDGAVSIPEDGGLLLFKFEIEEATDRQVIIGYELGGSAVFGVNYAVGDQTPPAEQGTVIEPATSSGGFVAFPTGETKVELELTPLIVDPKLAAPVTVIMTIADSDYDADPIAATVSITTRLIRYQYGRRVISSGFQPTSAPTCPLPEANYAFAYAAFGHSLTYQYIDPSPFYIGFIRRQITLQGNNNDPLLYRERSIHNSGYGNTQVLIDSIPYQEFVNGAWVRRMASYDEFLYFGSDPVGDFNMLRASYLNLGFFEQIVESWDGYCNYIEI